MANMRADDVIVEASSTACMLVNRLSEDAATRTLLIETGRRAPIRAAERAWRRELRVVRSTAR